MAEAKNFRTVWHAITQEFVGYEGSAPSPNHEVRVFPNRESRLRGSRQLLVFAQQRFTIIQSGIREFETRLTSYQYSVDDALTGHEIMAFHWHRGALSWPHIHIGAGSGVLITELQTAHVPSGPVQLAGFVRFLIADFGVDPLRDDRERILASGV